MHYLDASAAVALIAHETHSEGIWLWFERADGPVAISPWTSTEVASALSMKLRIGEIDAVVWTEAAHHWHRLTGEGLIEVDVTKRDFATAASFLTRHHLKLRAGDALHLAIVEANNGILVSFDKAMIAAA